MPDLVARHRANLLDMRRRRALLYSRRLAQHHRSRRSLGDKGEAPVLINRDLDRDDGPGLALRRRVVRLDEVHDVYAVLAQGRTYRRCRAGLTGQNLQLEQRGYLLATHS